jgi:hypothetical protein
MAVNPLIMPAICGDARNASPNTKQALDGAARPDEG